MLALEHFDEESARAQKAEIFSCRIHIRVQPVVTASTPDEALALCLDQCGRVDFDVMARLLSCEKGDLPTLMRGQVYENPQSGEWQMASEYLSGDVRCKLEEAQFAQQRFPQRYQDNVKALLEVLPQDLEPWEIKAVLGAPWIDSEDIKQFCQDLLQTRPYVNHEPLTGTWGSVAIVCGAFCRRDKRVGNARSRCLPPD